MRLKHSSFGGVAVILSLIWWPQQVGPPRPLAGAGVPVAQQDTAPTARDTVTSSAGQDTATAASRTPPGPTADTTRTVQATTSTDSVAPDPALAAVAPDTEPPLPPGLVRLGLSTRPLPVPVDLESLLPDPTRQRLELRSRIRNWGDEWAESVREELEARRRALWERSRPVAEELARMSEAAPPDTRAVESEDERGELVRPRPPPADSLEVAGAETATAEVDTAGPAMDTIAAGADPEESPQEPARPGQEPELLPDVFGDYADLGMLIQGRVEMGGGWNRFRPCDVTVRLNCDPSLIPTIKPDIQFGVRVGGTVTDRIHVAVDYDNRREFDAANNINVFYEGLEDEILKRVEVGDVSLSLPQSRYLTQGIPSGNFGFRATGQMGPIDFQTVWAQQKGDLGTRELQVGGGGQGFEQDQVTILDDADYERGRFFFLFDPDRLSGYPHIDIQRLNAFDAPLAVRPNSVIKLYRYEAVGFGTGAQVPEGFIKAVAVASDTVETSAGADSVVADSLVGLFRPLVEGEDFVLHQSGLWIQLRSTLPDREGLALTYIAADGTRIGDFNAEELSDAHSADPDNVPPPTLELIKGVNHRPGTATWQREMHHIYRVSASPGVVRGSVELTISQGDPEVGNTFRTTAGGTQLEFLKIFGLDDDPTDNELDESKIYEALTGAVDVSAPTGTYIAFPTLEPFVQPPPLRNVTGAVAGEPFALDPGDRNSVIYEEPNDQIRRGSSLYLLTIRYRQRFEGFVSTIPLGVGGVREGSDKVIIEGQQLIRGEDYTIDYDVGQIELREPERWFGSNPNARVQVRWEQKPLFQLAPTSVFGLQASYGLGRHGEISLIGLSQTEKTLQTRPELGLEPGSVKLGGLSGRLNFQPGWLNDLAEAVPGVEAESPSSLRLDGEIAMSVPNTNTQGVTYLEDFEGGSGFTVPLVTRAWRQGSAPGTAAGAENVAPLAFDITTAGELVWQDQGVVSGNGQTTTFGPISARQIDDQISQTGIQSADRGEPVLWMTSTHDHPRNPDPVPGPSWASITNVISATGRDFTTIEFLEFYVAVSDVLADSVQLIIDLGTISEDAFAIDSLDTPAGIGRLNQEVNPPQIWSNIDDVGLWGTGCRAEPGGRLYLLGDPRANCTNNNGLEDTEDLNQNGVLDTEERFFRYTVNLADPNGPYFVREANELAPGVTFRLFRIPLRRPDHSERVTEAEFQNVRHMRMTVINDVESIETATLILARMRFLGSRWLKRGRAGVIAGLADTALAADPAALVEVGPISTLDARYVPPPGITNQAASQADQFSAGQNLANEQSLSVRFDGVGPNERAEVYLQYPQTPRDLLGYRTLRLWALGIEGEWGTNDEPLRFVTKIGEDARNFYLFQRRLPRVSGGAGGETLQQAWRPEIEVDLDRFIALRARAEEILLQKGGLAPDSVLQVWDVDIDPSADSTYAIVISQRSRAPNLAAVRQISVGVFNAGTTNQAGEVWIDDIRLGAPVDNTGMVGQVSMDLQASDFLGLNFSYASENPYFRQLAQEPSFRSSRRYQVGGSLRLDRMLPESWSLNMPVSVDYSDSRSEPLLLPRTDIDASQLSGLRVPQNQSLRSSLSLSRRGGGPSTPWVGWLIDGSALRLSYDRQTSQTSRSRAESDVRAIGYSFRSDVADVSLPLFPGPVNDLLFFIPSALRDARLRLTPQSIQFNTGFSDASAETRRFREILELPEDSAITPIVSLNKRLQTNASVGLEPLQALTGRIQFSQNREITPTGHLVQSAAARRIIDSQRSDLFGIDLGWETSRNLDINWTYRPNIASWLTPQATLNTRFTQRRGASFITDLEGDTVLTSDFNNARSLRLATGFNAPVLARDVLGTSPTGMKGLLLGLFDRIDIFTVSWLENVNSSYSRRTARPDFSYQLAFEGPVGLRTEAGDTASRVGDSKALNLSSGVRLPLGASIGVDYAQSDQFLWSPINRTRAQTTTWPNVRLNWNRLPIPGLLRRWLRNWGFRTGYTIRTTESLILNADQRRDSEVRTLPVNVNLALTTNWSFDYSLTMSDEERRDATGATFGESNNQSVQVTGNIRPLTRTGSFRNPIRVSLRLSQQVQQQCRRLGAQFADQPLEPGEGEGLQRCEPFTDRTIRSVDLTVGTDLPPFTLGLQGTWRDVQSELGQRPGNTQLEISAFGQFQFESGEIR